MPNFQSDAKLSPRSSSAARRVLSRAAAMGLAVASDVEGREDEDLLDALDSAVASARVSGIANVAGSYVRRTASGEFAGSDDDFIAALGHIDDSLERSPLPGFEIPELVRVFGWPTLAELTGAAEVSLRRYAAGQRSAPMDLAERIHFLALLVGDLRAGYNEFGVRNWIGRPRRRLDGKRPIDILRGNWSPADPRVEDVRQLATWVAEPTAAT